MSELIQVKVNVDMTGIADRFTELCQDRQLKLSLNQLLAKKCDPYVPRLSGMLSKTVEITPEYVEYVQPYAHYQYHGVGFNHTLDYHPLATALWDEAMLRDHREEFEEEVRQKMARRYKELYG